MAKDKLTIRKGSETADSANFASWHFSRQPNTPDDLLAWAKYVNERELGARDSDSSLFELGVKIIETTWWIMDSVRQAMPSNAPPVPTKPQCDDLFDDGKRRTVPNYDASTVRDALRLAINWADQLNAHVPPIGADATSANAASAPARAAALGASSSHGITVDHAANEIRWHDKVLDIPKGKPRAAMCRLIEAGLGQVVSHLDLAKAVTPGMYAATVRGLPSVPSDVREAVKAGSAALRAAKWPFMIENVRGRGYRLCSLKS